MKFTTEEKFLLDVTKILCDWDNKEISSEVGMQMIDDLNVQRLTGGKGK